MATPSQTYGSQESAGVTVSLFSDIPCQPAVDRLLAFSYQVLVTCGTLSLVSLLGIAIILGVCNVVLEKLSVNVYSLLFCRLGLLPFPDIRGASPLFFRQNAIRSHPGREILLIPSHMQPISSCWCSTQHRVDCWWTCKNWHSVYSSSQHCTTR